MTSLTSESQYFQAVSSLFKYTGSSYRLFQLEIWIADEGNATMQSERLVEGSEDQTYWSFTK